MKKSWWKAVSRVAMASALMAMSACSTIVKGSDQSITIVTEPNGAQCILARDGNTVGAVGRTPGSTVVTKSKDDITVTCEREGFMKTSEIVESGASGWSAGNILFGLLGGGIGLIVDSASGAMHQYPEMIHVALVPESFSTEEGRDQFFDARVADLNSKFEAANQELENQCGMNTTELCEIKSKDLEAAREKRVSIIEQQRQAAPVKNSEANTKLR